MRSFAVKDLDRKDRKGGAPLKSGFAAFPYNKAWLQPQSRHAQRLTSFVIRHFWLPVGGGVKPDSEVDWILSFILGDPQGADIARRIDATIAKLPGLQWFDRLSRSREEALRQLNRLAGPTAVLARQVSLP